MSDNWPTIIWVCMALLTGLFNARIWWDAVADYRWAEATETVRLARVLTARDQLMLHSFLFAVQVDMLIVGIVALAFPDGLASRLIIVGGLILIQVMLATAAIWGRANWHRIVRLLEQEQKRKEDTTAP